MIYTGVLRARRVRFLVIVRPSCFSSISIHPFPSARVILPPHASHSFCRKLTKPHRRTCLERSQSRHPQRPLRENHHPLVQGAFLTDIIHRRRSFHRQRARHKADRRGRRRRTRARCEKTCVEAGYPRYVLLCVGCDCDKNGFLTRCVQ